jgi:hypothetical protein
LLAHFYEIFCKRTCFLTNVQVKCPIFDRVNTTGFLKT